MNPVSAPFVVLVCLGLVFAGIAVGVPADVLMSETTTETTAAASTASGSAGVVSNEYLEVGVTGASSSQVGRSVLRTSHDGEDVRLLSTSFDVVVDGEAYTTGTSSGVYLSQYLTQAPTVDGESVVTEWTLPEGVVVTQTAVLDGRTADLLVTVANAGSEARDVTVRYDLDHGSVWLDGPESVVRNATTYESPSFDSWRVLPSAPVAGRVTTTTAPTTLRFGPLVAGGGQSTRLTYELGSLTPGDATTRSFECGLDERVRDDDVSRVSIAPDWQQRSEPTVLPQLLLDEVFLTEGGWLVVYDAAGDLVYAPRPGFPGTVFTPPGPRIGAVLDNVPYAVIVGQSQEVTVVAFRDTDGDRIPDVPETLASVGTTADQPYVVDGAVLSDTQFVTVGQPPVVDLGPDVTVRAGETVVWRPTIEDDYAEGPVWTQLSGPSVDVQKRTDWQYQFTAPAVSEQTTLTFLVTVDDYMNNSGSDRLNVTVVPEGPTATVDLRGGPSLADGTQVVVDAVSLPTGGFVAIHDERLADGDLLGSVVGVSAFLSPGSHEDVVVTLFDVPGATDDATRLTERETQLTAMVHRDDDADAVFDYVATGGDVDRPYTDLGSPVTDTETVSTPQPVYYQLDLVAGEPYPALGPESGNPFYADADEDRLFRFAHGNADEGLTERGTAWPTEALRTCIDTEPITVTNGVASVTVTVHDDCPAQTLTLAVYEKPGPGFDRSMDQHLLGAVTTTADPGTYTLRVTVPTESES
jgi:hypothetical protein